jgi:hypothetical protein
MADDLMARFDFLLLSKFSSICSHSFNHRSIGKDLLINCKDVTWQNSAAFCDADLPMEELAALCNQ